MKIFGGKEEAESLDLGKRGKGKSEEGGMLFPLGK